MGLNPAEISPNEPVAGLEPSHLCHHFAGKTGGYHPSELLICKQEVAGSIPAGSIPTTAGKSGDMDIVVVSAAADHRSSAGRDVSVHGADPRRRAGDPHLFWTMCRAV